MKKLLLLVAFTFAVTTYTSAQVVTAQEVEAVFEQSYGGIPKKWQRLDGTC